MSEPITEQRLREIEDELRHIPKEAASAQFSAAHTAQELLAEVRRVRRLLSEEDADRVERLAQVVQRSYNALAGEAVQAVTADELRETAKRIREVRGRG